MEMEEYFAKIDLSEIERYIEESQEEHIALEFKTVNHPIYNDGNKNDDKKNFSKVLSGFANSNGGIVIWGIKAQKNLSGQDVAKEKKPIKELLHTKKYKKIYSKNTKITFLIVTLI